MINSYVIWLLSGTVFGIITAIIQDWNTVEKRDTDKAANSTGCTVGKTEDGFDIINCSLGASSLFDEIPKNAASHPQVLDLSDQTNLKIDSSIFDNFAEDLIRLIMRGHKNVKNTNDKNLKSKLFASLTKLQYLQFTSSNLVSNFHEWQLPENLITYIVDNNSYTSLDLHWCTRLTTLIVNYNNLLDIPILEHKSNPPLTSLSLMGNPLTDFTVEDIAGLCELAELKLEFSDSFHLGSPDGYCECIKFENWTRIQRISGTTYSCSKTTKDCPNTTLDDALKNHEICSPTPPIPSKVGLISLLAITVIFVILALGAIWVVDKYLTHQINKDDEFEDENYEE